MTGSVPLMARVAKIMIIVMTGAYSRVMTLAKGHLFTRLLIGKPEARIDSPVSLVD
jgi:hypothetical protein